MRLLRRSLNPDGTIEVKMSISSIEDLWHLYNFVLPGDAIRTKTKRKVIKENSMGSQAAVMKMLTLEIIVKQIDFTPEELRIQGTNRTESEYIKIGAHHTLTVHAFPMQNVTVIKGEWNDIWEERLHDACNQECNADTAAVLLGLGECQVLLVTPSFIHCKAKVEVTIAKKHKKDGMARDKSIHKFFKQVLDAMLTHVDLENIKLLLICSPAHVREEFLNYAKEVCQRAEHDSMRTLLRNLSKVVLVKVNSNTVSGLREAFKDPAVASRMESTRCSSDIALWECFQNTLSKDPDRCVYTPQLVYRAAVAGAVSKLMISDAVFRSPDTVVRHFFLCLYHFVRKNGASTVHVFSSHHITGEQLTQLGAVAAILFFPCPELDDVEVISDFIYGEEAIAFVRENAPPKVTVQ